LHWFLYIQLYTSLQISWSTMKVHFP